MSDNAKNKTKAAILGLLLAATMAPAAESFTPAQLAARFANTKFALRAELQAPRPAAAAQRPAQPTAPSPRLVAANF